MKNLWILNRISRNSKYDPNIVAIYRKWLNFYESSLQVKVRIVSVISETLDTMNTAQLIRSAGFHDDEVKVVISKRWTTPYLNNEHAGSWAKALNDGLKYIETQEYNTDDILFCMSDTADITYDLANKLLSEFIERRKRNNVFCLGPRFHSFNGKSYEHPRNTCCMWDLSMILLLGGFNEQCDLIGGQEDYEMQQQLAKLDGWSRILQCGTNAKLRTYPSRSQSEKEANELKAIKIIQSWHYPQ